MNSSTFVEKVKRVKISPINTFNHPSEEQGIIFDHINCCRVREYLLALDSSFDGPKNILAVSRVNGGRIIIFLATKEIMDKFQSEHGGFTLCNDFVKTRKLKTPAIKL